MKRLEELRKRLLSIEPGERDYNLEYLVEVVEGLIDVAEAQDKDISDLYRLCGHISKSCAHS